MLPKTLEEAIEFANKTGYPLIMKPDIGVGASGATKINNEEELKNNWDGKVNIYLKVFERRIYSIFFKGKFFFGAIYTRKY